MSNIGYIYLVTCVINGKFYVGQTRKYSISGTKTGIITRWKRHLYLAKMLSNDCPKLNNAIRKYGEDNFLVTKIISCPIDELNDNETYYIQVFDSVSTGYNCSLGGDKFNFTEEQQKLINKKISDKAKERWTHEEYRSNMSIKISAANKKKMWEPEIRKNLLDAVNKTRITQHLPSNIYELKKNGILVGYRACITINNTRLQTNFGSRKFTLEQNLKKAKQCLQKFMKSLK